MKIGILGTRGIPNHYGGFEQFAEYLSQYLVTEGDEVYVYNSHTHPYQETTWKGVHLIHQKDPEDQLGTAGQFLYDLNCIRDARKRDFDAVLQLGYTSSSVWGKLLPKNAVIITNMDGLEWKRTKFSKPVRRFIKFAESLAITTSDFLIADSIGIQEHLQSAYGATSKYIPYGAHVFKTPEVAKIEAYAVAAYAYNMLVARLEPENSIEVILDGVVASGSPMPFLVIGNHNTAYGAYLKDKFKEATHIRFVGGVYNLEVLNNLRYYSNLYFHGHTVGGTNPSLLEAMASGALLVAHDNIFNRSILGDEALYFSDASDVAESITKVEKKRYAHFVGRNRNKIEEIYSWELINKQYREYMLSCLAQTSKVNQD